MKILDFLVFAAVTGEKRCVTNNVSEGDSSNDRIKDDFWVACLRAFIFFFCYAPLHLTRVSHAPS